MVSSVPVLLSGPERPASSVSAPLAQYQNCCSALLENSRFEKLFKKLFGVFIEVMIHLFHCGDFSSVECANKSSSSAEATFDLFLGCFQPSRSELRPPTGTSEFFFPLISRMIPGGIVVVWGLSAPDHLTAALIHHQPPAPCSSTFNCGLLVWSASLAAE